MKKIGNTDDGNVIVEMTPGEWDSLNNESVVTHEPCIKKETNVIEWKKDFWKHLLMLDISVRCRNKIAICAGIQLKDNRIYSLNRSYNEDIFNPSLAFTEWCCTVIDHEVDMMSLRNFGYGMQAELETAIRRYLDNEAIR